MKNKILVACFMLLPFSAYADNELSDLRSVVNFQVSIIIPEKTFQCPSPSLRSDCLKWNMTTSIFISMLHAMDAE